MPFGLTNTLARFQRALHLIITIYKLKTCQISMDDRHHHIFQRYRKTCASRWWYSHNARRVLSQTQPQMCRSFTNWFDCLGHIIKPYWLEIHQSHTKSLLYNKHTTNRYVLRYFLDLCNVYCRLTTDFIGTAHPLNKLLQKCASDTLELYEEQLTSFNTFIKNCSSHVISLPRTNFHCSVDTDDSAHRIGCTMFQKHEDGTRNSIRYLSRSLNEAERSYYALEHECLGLV